MAKHTRHARGRPCERITRLSINGRCVVQTQANKRRIAVPGIVTLLALVACTALCVLVIPRGIAQGAAQADDSTLGVGDTLSVASTSGASTATFSNASVSTAQTVSDSGSSLQKAQTRSITVSDPDPVVLLSAVDMGNIDTIQAAAQVGTTDPLPTAPLVQPDTTEDGWMTGDASAYSVSDCINADPDNPDAGRLTASGRTFSDSGVTVAVPQGQEYLLGRAIEINYNGITVVATVTDTGSFGSKYGRVLDLAGGVYKAFGASSSSDWGVRTVSYRFL